jgi:hypothetical protein
MILLVSAKVSRGESKGRDRLTGWPEELTGPLSVPAEISLYGTVAPQACLLRLALDPTAATLAASAAGGSLHYFRLAGATLRPLPAEAVLSFARGDAYIAVSPGALRLTDSPAIARYLHLRDGFNAERLAEGLLRFLAQESGQAEFPEDVTVLVVEAR